MSVPTPLRETFRIATSSDIRSCSFGALTATHDASSTIHDNVRGTLHDQRIFGPIKDFVCACGKYSDESNANMICDVCGVKIASRSIRSVRFGHIELKTGLRHPFDSEIQLNCFPVIFANYFESSAGRELQDLYDNLINLAVKGAQIDVVEKTSAVIRYLTPFVTTFHNWNVTSPRNALARGIALECRA